MRVPFFMFILIGFLYSCSNSSDTKTQSNDSIDAEEPVALEPMNQIFPELHQYFYSQDSSFTADGFEQGEAIVKNDSLQFEVDTAELRKFYPYLLFNADSSYALDLVSYNYDPEKKNGKIIMQEMGPDFEVSIIDMKAKEKKRVLFFGPSGASVLDAKWRDKATVLIAGAIDWTGADSLRPVVWKYDTRERTLQQFVYHNKIHADWSKYPQKVYELNR